MKKLLFTAAFSVLLGGMCLLSGCGDVDDNGELKPASSYGTHEIVDFTYDLRNDFKPYQDYDNIYRYKKDRSIMLNIMYGNAHSNTSPEILLEYHGKVYNDVNVIKNEVIKSEKHDVAYFYCETEDEDNGHYFVSDFEISESGESILVTISHKEKDAELAKALALEILDSLKYNGDYADPVGTQLIDHGKFSFDLDPKFKRFYKGTIADDNSVNINYTYADNLAELLSSLSVTYLTDKNSDSIEELAISDMERFSHDTFTEEPHEIELNGLKCWRSVRESDVLENIGIHRYTKYFIEDGDNKYRISYVINKSDDWEEVEADFEELISSINFK